MISKINFAQGIQKVQVKPSFKANNEGTEPVTQPNNGVSFKGAEALANYNKPNVTMPFDKNLVEVETILPTIIEPDSIGSIEGEKIYGSNGKLNSIVNRVGDNVVIYRMFPDNDNMIESITATDKKTGNIVKEQMTHIGEEGTIVGVAVYEPVTGKQAASTEYVNGEPVFASKTLKDNDVMFQSIGYNFKNGHYDITEYSKDGKYHKFYEFNSNKDLISMDETKNMSGVEVRRAVNLYNGAVISSRQERAEVLPNNMGREVLNDPDLVPAKVSVHPDSIEGKKTFYSNGSLESVTAGDLVYNYSPEGDVTSIKDGNKTTVVNNDFTTITEDLGDGASKITEYYKDGYVGITYKKDDYEKHLSIDNNGNPVYYSEDEGNSILKTFSFNDKGMLVSAWGDNI